MRTSWENHTSKSDLLNNAPDHNARNIMIRYDTSWTPTTYDETRHEQEEPFHVLCMVLTFRDSPEEKVSWIECRSDHVYQSILI